MRQPPAAATTAVMWRKCTSSSCCQAWHCVASTGICLVRGLRYRVIHRWKEESVLFTTAYHRVSESSCETAASRSNDCSLVAVMPADASALDVTGCSTIAAPLPQHCSASPQPLSSAGPKVSLLAPHARQAHGRGSGPRRARHLLHAHPWGSRTNAWLLVKFGHLAWV